MKLHPRRVAGLLVAVGVATVAPLIAEAQELLRFSDDRSTPVWSATDAPRIASLEPGDTAARRRTYWLEGGLILGAAGAVLGGGLAEYACKNRDTGGGRGPCWDNTLLGFVFGFGTGGSLGALIGGLIDKPERKNQNTADIETRAETIYARHP
jgi:hypothetical protein